jgi:hypothetical protein
MAIAIYKIVLRLVSKQLFTANMSDLHLSTDSFRQTLSDFQAAARTTVVQTNDSQVAITGIHLIWHSSYPG